MISEKDLITRIKNLRKIQPSHDWVVFTKERISGQKKSWTEGSIFEIFPRFLFQPKMVLAGSFSLVLLFSIFVFIKNALPGDLFYSLKQIAEKSQTILASQAELSQINLEIANKRLEDLTKIAENNQAEKLAPALQAYQASIAEAAKNLIRAAATTSDPVAIKRLATETQKLEEGKIKLEKVYGIAGLDIEDVSNPTKLVLGWLIKDLGKRSLSQEQQLIFNSAKTDYDNQNYNSGLEKILKLNDPR